MRRHGFAVDDEGLKEQFEEWARFGGGRFFDAAGAVIGSGVVAGDAARVPPGTYTAEVRSDPPRDVPDVMVGNGEELVLSSRT